VSAGAARLCGRCGRVRPISQRAGRNGPDICSSCWRPPAAVCTVCGDERPCSGVAAGRPICSRCRPRRTSRCAHCGAQRPAAVRWPEGPICDPCYTAALRRRGTCTGCGHHRRLVAPPGPAAATCAACSGAGPAGHVCAGCGAEDKLDARGTAPDAPWRGAPTSCSPIPAVSCRARLPRCAMRSWRPAPHAPR